VALVPWHGARKIAKIARKDAVMSGRCDGYKPDGWHAVTPRLFTTDVAGLVHFLQVVFDAKGDLQADRPSELRIGDAMVMVSDGGGVREPMAPFLYVYVPDADLTYRRAIAAGGRGAGSSRRHALWRSPRHHARPLGQYLADRDAWCAWRWRLGQIERSRNPTRLFHVSVIRILLMRLGVHPSRRVQAHARLRMTIKICTSRA
jgi:hypothetical protein